LFSHYIFWPWFAGLVFFGMGLYSVRKEFAAAVRLEKIIALGRVFAASALAAFGAEHFVNIRPFSPMIPHYLPFHPFWVVFVGLALFAGALSLAWNRYTKLSCTLLAVLMFLFVLLLHLPNAAVNPHDRFGWTVVLRETSFAAGFIAFAGSLAPRSRPLILMARIGAGIPYLFFAVMHILHPQNTPGVPLPKLSPSWFFWPHVWATITALFLLAAGVAILIDRYARTAAGWLGLWMGLLTLVLYLPILLTSNGGMALIEGVNYVYDTLLFAGTILLLASAMPKDKTVKPAAESASLKKGLAV